MHVAKWGNSLAVRIPASVVAALRLKEGDQVSVTAKQGDGFEIERDRTREEARARLEDLARKAQFPPGWKFDREEIYEQRIRELGW